MNFELFFETSTSHGECQCLSKQVVESFFSLQQLDSSSQWHAQNRTHLDINPDERIQTFRWSIPWWIVNVGDCWAFLCTSFQNHKSWFHVSLKQMFHLSECTIDCRKWPAMLRLSSRKVECTEVILLGALPQGGIEVKKVVCPSSICPSVPQSILLLSHL